MCAAGTISAKERVSINSPSVNFTGLDGSRDPRRIQIQAKTGAKRITTSGSTDWNQLEGYVKPKIVSLVARSAKRFRLDPACSKPAQNISAKNDRIAIAPMRAQSVPVNGCFGAFASSIASVCAVFACDLATRYFFPATY